MSLLVSPVSYVLHELFTLQPLWPYYLSVHAAGANSGAVDPDPAQRTRHDSPTQYSGTPWTTRAGSQQGRIWLQQSDESPENGVSPGEIGFYTHLRTGMFIRFNRDHTSETSSERIGNYYGFGHCRAKELNGQISIGNPALVVSLREGEGVSRTSTDADGCNGAEIDDSLNYNACPFGLLHPEYRVGQDTNGDIWTAYMRMPLDIPQGATIIDAKVTLYFSGVGTSFDVNIKIMNVDDVDSFDTTDAYTNPLYGDAVGPITLAPLNGNGAAYILSESFEDQLQHIVDRPGWSSGQFIGFQIAPVSGLSDGQYHTLAYLQSNPTMSLSVSYRDITFVGGPTPLPPRLIGVQRLYTDRLIDTSFGPEMEEEPGGGVDPSQAAFHEKIADDRTASAYNYCWITPVPPLNSWWSEGTHGDAPYPDDAHIGPYPFNELFTLEQPCMSRKFAPYGYQSLGQPGAWIDPGIRAIAGFAFKTPKPGIEPIYAYGCAGYEGETYGLQESVIQRYEGRTATRRQTYPSPLKGWWIEHTAYLKSWMVYGDELSFLNMPYGSSPDSYGPMIHWNAWTEIIVRAKWNGPSRTSADWSDFAAWVDTLDHKWGGTIIPRTQDQCNDILLRCADIPCALGDTLRPSASVQETVCEETSPPADTAGRQLACVTEGRLSYWYLPTEGSNHMTTPTAGPVVPQMPESGLPVEFEWTRYKDPDQNNTETVHGWYYLGFQTNHPIIKGEPAVGDTFPLNRIEQWIPFKQTGPDPLSIGEFIVKWTDANGVIGAAGTEYFSSSVFDGATEGQLESALENAFGTGNVSVTKTGSSPDTYEVEFIGDLAGTDVFSLLIEISYYDTVPSGFEFERTQLQAGRPGGLT